MGESQHTAAARHRGYRVLSCIVGALALAAYAVPAAAATAHPAAGTSQVARATGGRIALHRVGTVNLRALAKANASRAKSAAPSAANAATKHRVTPLGLPPWVAKAAARASAVKAAAGGLTGFTDTNVAGEHGFDGMTSAINAGNNPVIGDVSPPDQGLAVGPSPAGTAVVEFVNESLNIYSPNGKTLLGAIPAFRCSACRRTRS